MARKRKMTGRGRVLGMLRANGEWLAIVQAFSNDRGGVVLAQLQSVAELKGTPRRKADRWVAELS